MTISNDGATILSMLAVEHPAGKIFVDLAQKQDKEVGDGTTSVVIIAAELLRRANELVKAKIHPTTIITGYRLACREAVKFMQEQLSINVAKRSTSKIIAKCVCIKIFYSFNLLMVLCLEMMTALHLWLWTRCRL